ncbi:Protoporphyrinogen oxidase [Planctomycetes bacterium Pla163]|uniref:Coproporphyrinogen III oxidase n=1 Tax=Rohdeia mirabilis TaxID=2528008 RepID=A0A518D4Y2_9BACT|nr:Protoporphyrinogen oxidase [Planctomycetes bacterium Pla163]
MSSASTHSPDDLPAVPSGADVCDLLVIGGGLAGLAAAERAARDGASVRLLEAGSRVGGVVGTERVAGPDGDWLFESGPHSVPGTARHFAAAVERLGLAERVVKSRAAADTRYLLWRGRLLALPSSPLGLLRTRLVSWRTKLRFLRESKRPWSAPADDRDPTLGELVTERFGADAAERIAGAFVRGVYAGEATALGTRSAFPRLWAGLLEHRSILAFLRASAGPVRTRLHSFEDGLGELPAAFARALGECVELERPVARIERDAHGRWCAHLADGTTRRGRALVLAVPAAVATALLEPVLAGDSRARAALDAVAATRSNGVRLVQLGLTGPLPASWIDGFGFLVPPDEARTRGVRLLGALVPSNVFDGRAPSGGATAACFYRLEGEVAAESPAATTERAQRELAAAIGAAPRDLRVATARALDWPAGAGGIPEYAPGHDRRIAALDAAIARVAGNLALAGSYTSGVSVDDVLARGERAAEGLLAGLAATASDRPTDPRTL